MVYLNMVCGYLQSYLRICSFNEALTIQGLKKDMRWDLTGIFFFPKRVAD